MADIFISYTREDRASAERLAIALEDQGWSVWWDPQIPAGKTFDEVIEQAIEAAKCVVVIWSKRSVSSRWVRTEASEGADRGILVPVLIEDVRIPLAFRRIQAANLVEWDGTTSHPVLQKLVSDIEGIVGPLPAAVEEQQHAEQEVQRKAAQARELEEEAAKPKTEEALAGRISEPDYPTVPQTAHRSPLTKIAVLGGFVVAAVLFAVIMLRERDVTPPTPTPETVQSPTVDTAPGERTVVLSLSQWLEVQKALTDIGFDAGAADGIPGFKTREAIALFQESRGFPPSGHLSNEQRLRLLSDAREAAHGRLGAVDGPATDSALLPEMVDISAGCFQMGSPPGEGDDERPQHRVCVDAFAMGKYEVTFDEYDRFANVTGREKPEDQGWSRGRRPVINVTWEEAAAYAEWLSQTTGKRFRLPTESEWEYATRAGTVTRWSFGDKEDDLDKYAWYIQNSRSMLRPAGEKKPNPWGLHDAHGNVWEWVEDCWHASYQGAPTDGSAWGEGDGGDCGKRVLRGGSCFNFPWDLRSANRFKGSPGDRSYGIGFRLAQDL